MVRLLHIPTGVEFVLIAYGMDGCFESTPQYYHNLVARTPSKMMYRYRNPDGAMVTWVSVSISNSNRDYYDYLHTFTLIEDGTNE